MSTSSKGHVLVTGAAGFTGHHMVMEAVKAGLRVRATDVSSRHYGAMFDALGVEFVASNLTKRQGLEALLDGIDAILHIAGIHDYSTPRRVMFAVNVDAVENICGACVATGVDRLIHLSSVGVYGYDWHSGIPVKEEGAKLTPPLNSYNESKWEGEKVVNRFQAERGLRATILRPAAIYGIRSEYGLYNAIKQVYSDRKRKRMLIVGSGDQIEAFVHVEDVCRAVIHAVENDSMIGEVYNVSDDSRITTAGFFNLICGELFGVQKEFVRLPVRILAPVAAVSQVVAKLVGKKPLLERATIHYMACDRIWDNTKLKNTGFSLKYPIVENGMRETLRWYKDNGWLSV
jgi:nucleoside-diphosphate-sugar epimerase